MTYSATSDPGTVQRDSDGAFIPVNDPRNADCRAYQAWLAQGNAPTPYVAPKQSVVLTYLQFRSLFTASENAAIMAAAQSNAALFDWLLQAAGAGAIDLTNPEVKAGLDVLVAAKLITAAREAAILANQPPA